MSHNQAFQSIFKINNVPIVPPVIDQKIRDEIKTIRLQVRALELKWQEKKEEKTKKEAANIAKQSVQEVDGRKPERRGSYTLSSPIFTCDMLPQIISIDSSESDKETVVDGFDSLQSEEFNDKSSKDLKNEFDKRSATPSSIYESNIEPQVNYHLKDLIEKQKREYLNQMEFLKNKFTNEQHELLMNIQSNLLVTSTPLNSTIMTCTTDDEDFTLFKTCLQSQSHSVEEKTIVNDTDAKIKAATTINAHARGFLTRRLIKTIYVQEHIRNIRETLQLVLNLSDRDIAGSPIHNILLKTKLFRQLQSDLSNFSDIFKGSTREKMKIIGADREIKQKRQAEENNENLSLSFQDVV